MKSCKEIAALLAPGNDLSFMERAETRMHLVMCKACQIYQKHLKILSFNYKKQMFKKIEKSAEKINKLEKDIIEKITKAS